MSEQSRCVGQFVLGLRQTGVVEGEGVFMGMTG